MLILANQRVERREAVESCAEANGVVQMRTLLAVVVESKGADADEPSERRVGEELPERLQPILLQGLKALLRINVRIVADAYQCEHVEEAADGAGNEDRRKEVNHNAPVAR